MEAILRSRIIKNLALLWFIWIALVIFVVYFFKIMGDINILRVCMPAEKITAGEDLSKYEGKKVRCDIRYIGYPVLQYYSATDPTQTIYACGYVALDDHLKNPFCVFVPVNRAEQMNYLFLSAWDSREGNTDITASAELKGFVRKLSIEDRQYFVEAVQQFYGNAKPLYGEVFYIDDHSVVGRHHNADLVYVGVLFVFLLLCIAAMYFLCTVRAVMVPKTINDFLLQSGMSKSRLESEFLRAEEVCKGIWISREITVYYDVWNFGVLRNRDLVWVYIKAAFGRHASRSNFVELYDKNQKHCAHILVNYKYDDVLRYYEENCPHMVVGDDEEKRSLFRFAFDKFLRLRYYWNIGMQYEDQPAQPGPDYDNDLCGYQNLSFDKESGRYEDDQEKPL